MNVLVIGRGEGGDEVVAGHTLTFVASGRDASGQLRDVAAFDYVLQHSGPANEEATAVFTALIAAGRRDRAVAVSGGRRSDEMAEKFDVAALHHVTGPLSVKALNWINVPRDFAGPATTLVALLCKTSHYLSALTIMCQGYLAAVASSDAARTDRLQRALARMGWTADVSVTVPSEIDVRNATWWRAGLGGDAFDGAAIGADVTDNRDDGIAALIDDIAQSRRIEPERVAIVYDVLCDRLKAGG
jgi:hypothetical protein